MTTRGYNPGSRNGSSLINRNPLQHPEYNIDWMTNKSRGRYVDPDSGPDPLAHNKTLCKICFTYKSVSGSCNC
jgi:hypothetical protein